MTFKFESSAIENISDVEEGKVIITFIGGRDYTYAVTDVEKFVSQLTEVITQKDSVGGFVNKAIRENLMTVIAV